MDYLHLASDESSDNTVKEVVGLAFPQFGSKIGGKSTLGAARIGSKVVSDRRQ